MQVGPVDVIFVGVKAWQVEEAARNMQPMVGPQTLVVPLQNGVEAPSHLVAVLGPEHVLGGLCGTISWVVAPGRIRNIGTANFIKFGELDNRRSERGERLRQLFEKAGVNVDIPSDIHKALWEKFFLVIPFGGVGAVSRAPIGIIGAIPETRLLLQQCMQEVSAVARASSIKLSDTVVADTMKFIDTLAANATTSLQRDIAEGKPSEIDFWNGAVVRLGQAVACTTPVNQFIYHRILCCHKNYEREAELHFRNHKVPTRRIALERDHPAVLMSRTGPRRKKPIQAITSALSSAQRTSGNPENS